MWEGYHITRRGYIVLALLLALLAYGLFSLGSLFSHDFKTVVDEGLKGTQPVVTDKTDTPSADAPSAGEAVQNPESTPAGDEAAIDDPPATETPPAISPEDLVKTATIVYFKPDSTEIDAQAKTDLIPFIKIALENSEIPIVIEGHAGLTSVVADNDEKLALKRAEAIRDYLVSKSIKAARIQIMSKLGTAEEMEKQQEIWKTMRAEIYFQGYAQGK